MRGSLSPASLCVCCVATHASRIQFYANNIRTYLTNLMKLQNEGTAKGDMVGAEEGKPTASFWGGATRKATGNIFKLADRDKVLSDADKVPCRRVFPCAHC